MLTGFNTNIRHRGVLFHVQSEDSGRNHPHVITHLFHGGNIMASEKSSYAEKVDDRDLESVVRGIMESQHKAVLKRLRAGDFDAAILARLGENAFEIATEPPAEAAPEVATEPPVDVPADTATAVPGATSAPEPSVTNAPATPSSSASPRPDAGRPFGEGIVSDKPLDEVILNYLVSNARKRKRQQVS
ncbi:MAG: hypothetical protein JRH01_07715 [Deltaproteobacteria bacterium]|nr:hypothetical protein [Deltaproteobacteria bacterium]MBW2395456.1 hypothetical protein [Deltaproteobacteria bacterium]